jgi:hypothetical protein
MCDVISIGKENIQLHDTFKPLGRVFIKASPTIAPTIASKPVYWDGFAREETLDEWTKAGPWKRADVLAEKFSIITRRGRLEYEVPPHNAIKVIILETPTQLVMRVISREPVGAETLVTKRFTKTGKRV